MRYEKIDDLPVHCQLHLPEPALHVYKDAWNHAWETTADALEARNRAWAEVRARFERIRCRDCGCKTSRPLRERPVECVDANVTTDFVKIRAVIDRSKDRRRYGRVHLVPPLR